MHAHTQPYEDTIDHNELSQSKLENTIHSNKHHYTRQTYPSHFPCKFNILFVYHFIQQLPLFEKLSIMGDKNSEKNYRFSQSHAGRAAGLQFAIYHSQ